MYDAIVVGARCAGSPTAMLLARRGYRVLLVDKATFPSDAISTHYLHYPAIARLDRWNLLDRVLKTGAPVIDRITWGMGDVYITGTAPEWDGKRFAVAPRRKVLDKILLDAAVEAGAELHEGFTVEEILRDGDRAVGIRGRERDGTEVVAHAPIVIGADGIHSLVASTFQPAEQSGTPPLTAVWYTYWQGTDVDHLIFTRLDGRELFLVPTNDDCVNVMVGWREHEFHEFRKDIEGNYHATLDLFPELAARVRKGRQVEPFYGTKQTRQWMRHPYGPGWVLVGDAGYHKDPIAGIGISDAFRQVEVLVEAVDDGLSGRRDMAEALAGYHAWRDESFSEVFEYYHRAATLDMLPPEMLQVIDSLRYDETERDRFMGIVGGFTSFKEFFSPENCQRILARAAEAGGLRETGGRTADSAWGDWTPGQSR
ncbi:FAD-dependent oxidoreductase [Longispora fulva]|nr:FAD-dependent oxidoreductase [Longispora fulva]